MFSSPLTPEQWAEARRLRAEGAPFAALAKQFGIAHSTISQRARREDWPSPSGSPSPRATGKSRDAAPDDTTQMRRMLARRVYSVMNLNLALMELRMQKQLKDAKKKDADIPAIDAEKEMRNLAGVMKTLEQTTELDPDRHAHADGGAKSSDAQARASEAAARRREIAERLEGLVPPA
jgi:IS30 family transposase